ncbi:hypothetical protein DE146DRAFT_644141 [Phaeosphaeria sp. MPI-PUGE-AT-0046c]|nr:hypothetical protein DE146DRAFT_644141 [Phaeosphaeria sp. MPI-PUGE-AT-0046c]
MAFLEYGLSHPALQVTDTFSIGTIEPRTVSSKQRLPAPSECAPRANWFSSSWTHFSQVTQPPSLHFSQSIDMALSSYPQLHFAAVTGGRKTFDTMSAAILEPSQPGRDGCILFRVPLELRVMIYHHVLCYAGGLTIDFDAQGSQPCTFRHGDHEQDHSDVSPNPLSLVCRRLHGETRGLIFEANSEIAVHSVGFTTPSSYVFNRFVKHLSTTAVRRLRTITINGARDAGAESLSWRMASSYFECFKPFCVANPGISVVVRFGNVGSISGQSWFPYCLAIRELIRDKLVDLMLGETPTPEAWVRRVMDDLGSTIFRLQELPPNLRFSVLTEFPRNGVLRMLDDNNPNGPMHQTIIVSTAQKIWKEGI